MRFTVDGWDPAYGTSLQEVSDELQHSDARVDVAVEVPGGRWGPVDPRDVGRPGTLLFVDGVRRIEAHVWVESDDLSGAAPGICASYAAGVVTSREGRAEVTSVEVRRGLFTTDPRAEAIDSSAGVWAVTHSAADATRAALQILSQALQRKLSELEIICAANARSALGDADNDLLVIDGPLRGRTALPRTIALIKSQQAAYLRAPHSQVVNRLRPGQRTPIFLLGTTWERFTWYLRLPGAFGSPWAGVVRVECAPDLSADEAVRLAFVSQQTLPAFASEPFREARAPHNLYPVAGLERHLRHRLGDPQLLRRALQAAAAPGLVDL